MLTDADPYGIEIMLTYRHGSLSSSHQNDALAVPSIRWIGILPSDIRKFGVASTQMTGDDTRKLMHLMKRPHINNELYQELHVLKQNERKAEIEGVSGSSCHYLIDVYLAHKLREKKFI